MTTSCGSGPRRGATSCLPGGCRRSSIPRPGEAGLLHGAVLEVADGPGHDEALLEVACKTVGAHHGGMSPADLQAELAACAVQAWEELLAAPQVTPG